MNNKIIRLLKWIAHLRTYNYRRDTWYFILKYGIGDTYIASAFFPYLIAKGDKVVALVTKESHAFIPSLFSHDVEVQVHSNLDIALIEEFGKYGKGHPIILHPLNQLNGLMVNVLGYKKFNLADMYKLLLFIELDFPPMPLLSVEGYKKEANEILSKYDLPIGNTVLLCPKANSLSEVDEEFWWQLANKLKSSGLVPVFMNSSIGSEKYMSIDFPLHLAIYFCNQAGYVVSLRSGFCDLVSTTTANAIVLYPILDKYKHQIIDSASLIEMKLSTGQKLQEMSFDFNTPFSPLIETISQKLTCLNKNIS